MKKLFLFIFFLFAISVSMSAQDATEYVKNTFYSNRIINGHSVEVTPAGRMDFVVSHHMGRISQGPYEFFGIDQSTLRLGLEYGITNRFMTGVGRSTIDKLFDGFIKYKIGRQSKGKKNMPVTLTAFSGIAVNSMKWTDTTKKDYFSSRLYYTFQLLAARKFNDRLSIQIAPVLIHRNMVATKQDANDVFSIGIAGKYRIFSRISVTAEYYYLFPGQIQSKYHNGAEVTNSLSLGLDIQTIKHVFQIQFSNSVAMAEKAFITETTEKWKDGNIHIGFTILTTFNIMNH